jgi:hypothetical protein
MENQPIRSESSGSSHGPKPCHLATKSLTHERFTFQMTTSTALLLSPKEINLSGIVSLKENRRRICSPYIKLFLFYFLIILCIYNNCTGGYIVIFIYVLTTYLSFIHSFHCSSSFPSTLHRTISIAFILRCILY